MSTNNFKYENILVVIPDFNFDNRCMNEDCEHFESEGINCEHVNTYYEFNTEDYNMYVKDLQEQLQKIGFDSCDRNDNDRSYSGQIIAEWSIYDKNGNIKDIEVVIRSGYYQGANIDYIITEGDYDYTETKTMKKKIEVKIRQLEKILRKNGEEYLKVASFSNGEAFYKKLNK